MRQFIRENPTPFIFLTFIVIAVGLFFLMRPRNEKMVSTPASDMTDMVTDRVPAEIPMPIEITTAPLSSADEKKISERNTWQSTVVTNQPTLKKPQVINLPKGWTAREDYLAVLLPESMPKSILNYRSVIMRPAKPLSRDDAIFSAPTTKDIYFKGRCKESLVGFTCYGGTNPETKHTFELMFY
jgi:hypothetical protein